jgi:hypothetical protein
MFNYIYIFYYNNQGRIKKFFSGGVQNMFIIILLNLDINF